MSWEANKPIVATITPAAGTNDPFRHSIGNSS
jgi:hypothetical protein